MMLHKIKHSENLHVLLWLIKDSCWMLEYKTMGTVMVLPTVAVALYIAWHSRSDWQLFWPNMAVLFWISANSIWMLAEFYLWFDKNLSVWFFVAGFMMIGIYLIKLLLLSIKRNSNQS